jgi:glycosyltransferase involved in cell wall biosynthesis
MKKTLLITAFFPPLVGGLEHYWEKVAEKWPAGSLVVLAPPSSLPYNNQRIEIVRRPFFPAKVIRPTWLPFIFSTLRVIRKKRIERVLFGHFATYAIMGVIIQRLYGLQYDLMSHGSDVRLYTKTSFGRWVLRQVLQNAHTVFANSQQTAQLLLHWGAPRVQVAPPAIDFSEWPDLRRDQARSQLGFTDQFLIVYIGHLVPIKGVDTLIRAFCLLSGQEQARLVIIGDGSERVALQRHVRTLDLPSDRIRFLGAIPDEPVLKAPWLSAADVLVLPSRQIGIQRESFGIVGLEAARYALPFVVTSSSGSVEYVRDKETGFIVQSDHPRELADTLNAIRQAPDAARECGRRLKELVQEKYSWERTLHILQKDD